MNKIHIIVIVFFLAGVQTRGEGPVLDAIHELEQMLESNPSISERKKATAAFYAKLEKIKPKALLAGLRARPEYFNIAYGEINNNIGSELSDLLFRESLKIEKFYGDRGAPGHKCLFAGKYTLKRFSLDWNNARLSSLQEAFLDPFFRSRFESLFGNIITAGSPEKRNAAEKRAVSFLDNFNYRPWRETLETASKKEPAASNVDESTPYTNRDIDVQGGSSAELITREDNAKPSSQSWFVGGVIGIAAVILIFILIKRGCTS